VDWGIGPSACSLKQAALAIGIHHTTVFLCGGYEQTGKGENLLQRKSIPIHMQLEETVIDDSSLALAGETHVHSL